ncbi:DedA family protein [bacterium]|nr:DedA family protein [bacterium]
MTLEAIVTAYGYPALFAGVFLEGETVLIIGGFMAHRGYLNLPLVIGASFLGAFLYTQLFFFLGRRGKSSFIERKPSRQLRAQKIQKLLEQYQTSTVIGFRFLYGLRTITPFIIGMSGYNPRRFMVLNALGTIPWAVIYGVVGFLFGQFLETVLADVKKYEMWIFLALAIAGFVVWLIYRIRLKHRIRTYDSTLFQRL